MSESSSEKYREDIKYLASLAYDEYKMMMVDTKRYQANLLKTYLWLSSLILGLQLTTYAKLLFVLNNTYNINFIDVVAAAISIIPSLVAFIIGVDTLRGRTSPGRPLGDLGQLLKIAKMDKDSDNNLTHLATIQALNDYLLKEKKTIHFKGIRMRAMSYCIIIAVGLSCTFMLVYLVSVFQKF